MRIWNNKKIAAIVLSCMILAVGTAVLAGSYISGKEEPKALYKEAQVQKGNLTAGITESGSVSMGTKTQKLEKLKGLGNTDNNASSIGLEVEEACFCAGNYAKVGDALLKLTKESVEEYRQALQKSCNTAELALEMAQMEAKSAKLNAQYAYDTNVAQGGAAQSSYDAAIAELQSSVDAAQAKLNESAAKIANYQSQIENGKDCSASLAEEQANYSLLAAQLSSAQNTQAVKTVEAKQKYEESMFNYNNAKNLYQMDTSDADIKIEEAQESLEEAQEALSYFQSLIGNGVIYAQYEGTVFSIGYAAGDLLSNDVAVASFADTENITMTVSVSQEDIAAIEIGDEVEIAMTAYGDKTYAGRVAAIDTSASSGTATVSYDVTAAFTEEALDVYQDMTGSVTFIAAQANDVYYVSKKAVSFDKREALVKVKRQDGTIESVPVETGITDGVNIEISGDVEEGDTVLIESRVKME